MTWIKGESKFIIENLEAMNDEIETETSENHKGADDKAGMVDKDRYNDCKKMGYTKVNDR